MSNGHSLLRACNQIGLALTMGVSMSACAKDWKEEVLLHDGTKIVIARVQHLGNRPTLESRERAILDETITFLLPGTKRRIVWSMSFRDDALEPNGVNVVLLGIVNGVPYIAGYPAGCIAYNKWKRPNPPQILFKYEGSQWKRLVLSEFPLQLTEANVIVGGPPAEGIKRYYAVAQVNEENRDVDTPEYRIILREPVKPGAVGSSVNCEELFSDGKGGWLGAGWFKHRTKEACLQFCASKGIVAELCKCNISEKVE